MPFRNCLARAFNAAAIRRDAPACSGVYGLSNSREWIYVGETNDIQARLLEHLAESDTRLKARAPTGFSFELCPAANRQARQLRLIIELQPACNGRMDSPRQGAGQKGNSLRRENP